MHSNAQDLSYCGQGYYMDLSVGYTPTGFGLELCGCSPQSAPCELVHIILQRTSGSVEESLGCTDIILTERWWREAKDLVDIFDPLTCEEYEESVDFSDRYILPTAHLDAGDTISILVCKTDPQDRNIIELSASPGTSCALHHCAPEIFCPVEVELEKNDSCIYVIPDFKDNIVLLDTCDTEEMDVTEDYMIIQSPARGTIISENQFVTVEAFNQSGEIMASCDISILLIADVPPVLTDPDPIPDIQSWEPLPPFQQLVATDTSVNDSVYILDVLEIIDPFSEDACTGYAVTYRWIAEGLCGWTTEKTVTFNVLPDTTPPTFASLPVDFDTIYPGASLPLLVDLVAINPDGTTGGITMNNYILPYEEDACTGYDVTYVWTAVDTCNNYRELTKRFFVAPTGDAPQFIEDPAPIPDIYTNDSLPIPQLMIAVNGSGDPSGIEVIHSIDPYIVDTCSGFEITYRWTATDTCNASTTVTQSFNVLPDTLAGFILAGIPDLMVQISIACAEAATIEIPIDLEQHNDKDITIIITDEMWHVIDYFQYNGPVDYDFGMGQFHAIYVVEDVCGNIFRDTINIDALDVAPPVFICPAEQQIVITDLETCSTEAVWTLPQAFDNCDDVAVAQLSGPKPGDTIGVGNYQIVYEAIDESGNSSACSFDLVVAPVSTVSFFCKPIEVPVDAFCDATISKEVIIGNQITSCSPGLEVTVFTTYDTLTGDIFDLGDYFGQTISYQICEPISGICCSNLLMLIDTLAPQILCPGELTITCLEDLEEYRPESIENCTSVLWQINDLDSTEICTDTTKGFSILKVFIAYDLAGNFSAPCSILFTVLSVDLNLLVETGVLLFPGDTILSCSDYTIDSVERITFGIPLIDSLPLEEELSCELEATYSDELLVDYQCTQIIKRRWSIKQIGCHHFLDEIEGFQIIKIVDTTGPILHFPDTILQINTEEYECIGYFDVKGIQWTDNCQDSLSLPTRIFYEYEYYEAGTLIPLPPGLHELIVYQEDNCRNTSKETITVKVIDNERPAPVCLQYSTVAVYHESVSFPATSLDAGSYDDCGIISRQIRKEFATCSDQDTIYKDFVRFCCTEVGQDIPVRLRTIDEAGNVNYCWGIVSVQDKIVPNISCPPDLVVSCTTPLFEGDDETDPYSALFGSIRTANERKPLGINEMDIISSNGTLIDGLIEDNCEYEAEINVQTVTALNQCGLGFIYRTFTAIDQSGNRSNSCTQKIEFRSLAALDSSVIVWPSPFIELSDCSGPEQLSPDILGQPEIPAGMCILEGRSYEDTYYHLSDTGDNACIKIIREWQIIDWCAPDPLRDILSFQQTIKITDTTAPLLLSCTDSLLQIAEHADCSEVFVSLQKQALDDCHSDNLLS